MLGRHRPSPGSWACSIRCTRRSTTIDLGEQLTIGPGPFVEPGSASRCRPFPLALVSTSVDARLRFCRHSSRVTAHERCPKSVGLARNKARVKRQSNVFGQARESGAARLSFAPPSALAGSSSSAARARVFTHPPHPGRPPGWSVSSSPSLGSIGPWHGVRGVPTHPRSSPLAQDRSWSRAALRAVARSHWHSLPVTLVSTSVDARLRFCRRSSRVTAHERCPKTRVYIVPASGFL
jgi:hypothetical protein